jgi:hypothetical protein
MLALVAALLTRTLSMVPSDDIWVYPNASEPAGDPIIRVWGNEGRSVPAKDESSESYSFGYMKWKLTGVPADAKLTGATLTLHMFGKPGYAPDQAKQFPLEARPLAANFDEKTWSYDATSTLMPESEPSEIYGEASPSDGEDVSVTLDLMAGKADFKAALAAALKAPSHEIAIALTSKMDASALGRAAIYRIRSRKDKDPNMQPNLTLVFD